MTSTIKVDNIQDQDGNNIINENANTITIGASGDTVSLAAGASQTGFGRTGTVDWQTTPKTASFTAVNGEGYFINSAGGAVTVTLPASPSAGNIVSVSDYNGTAETNSHTIARNGSNINGSANNIEITKNNTSIELVYVDATTGWQSVATANTSDITNPFIVATGGTETTSGDFKIHTFTGPGTFTVSNAGNACGSNTVDYLVVAGAGGAGGVSPGAGGGSGGGAGGYRESSGAASGCYTASPLGACVSALPVTAQAYPITVGSGGSPGPGSGPTTGRNGGNGNNSIFSTITATGGGGGRGGPCGSQDGEPGGSGSGASGGNSSPRTGGSGNTPPVSPPQGNDGGDHNQPTSIYNSAGGGGATAAGQDVQPSNPNFGNGGAGATTNISGSPFTKSTGGNGGSYPSSGPDASSGPSGAANSGNGGTGGTGAPGAPGPRTGGGGGSGIVIIRYRFQ